VVKLDAGTGEEIWAVDRKGDPVFENKHSYASPFMYEDGRRKFLITHGQDCTAAFDPETGAELARLEGLNGPSEYNHTQFDQTLRFVASPSFAEGIVVIPTAKRGPVVAVNVNEEVGGGDLTGNPRAVRWISDKTPDVSIPLVLDDMVFFLRKPGHVFAVDRDTGEELFYERIHPADYRSSPTSIDGCIYCCSNDGLCTVLRAGREFEVVAENDLGEPITASPVVSNGTLYLRSFNALYAIRRN
jgi:outer membrane protein assembly factor BamB